jgi:hypothetical protein
VKLPKYWSETVCCGLGCLVLWEVGVSEWEW